LTRRVTVSFYNRIFFQAVSCYLVTCYISLSYLLFNITQFLPHFCGQLHCPLYHSAVLSLANYMSEPPQLSSAAVTRQRVSISNTAKDFSALHSAWAGCKARSAS
jgi:hypothetical protein